MYGVLPSVLWLAVRAQLPRFFCQLVSDLFIMVLLLVVIRLSSRDDFLISHIVANSVR